MALRRTAPDVYIPRFKHELTPPRKGGRNDDEDVTGSLRPQQQSPRVSTAEFPIGSISGSSMSSKEPQLVATIVYNSLTHATMAGFRGAAESQQIIFHAEGLSIHLRISKVKAERIILGQLLQRSSHEFLSETTVSLVSGAEKIRTTTTNSHGEFRFSGVPAGALTIEAEIPSRPLLIANFKVIGD
ncbi:MAG: hypothetical protein DMG11_02840 [Acidobacteria bacterium]|nr:MAG: hypothetical protein DMG11_02840 [Acidobacteriota bacterium]